MAAHPVEDYAVARLAWRADRRVACQMSGAVDETQGCAGHYK